MDELQFSERIEQIRRRFKAKLSDRIGEVETLLQDVAEGGQDKIDLIDALYRRVHEICGIGPTLGFEATGEIARTLDGVLAQPFKERRTLQSIELAQVKTGVAALRAAARIDMHL